MNYILLNSFVWKIIIKLRFFRIRVALQKMFIFSIRDSKNLRIRVALQNQKSSYLCCKKETGNSRIFVSVSQKKMCIDRKIFVFVVQRKRKFFAKGRNLRVRNSL